MGCESLVVGPVADMRQAPEPRPSAALKAPGARWLAARPRGRAAWPGWERPPLPPAVARTGRRGRSAWATALQTTFRSLSGTSPRKARVMWKGRVDVHRAAGTCGASRVWSRVSFSPSAWGMGMAMNVRVVLGMEAIPRGRMNPAAQRAGSSSAAIQSEILSPRRPMGVERFRVVHVLCHLVGPDVEHKPESISADFTGIEIRELEARHRVSRLGEGERERALLMAAQPDLGRVAGCEIAHGHPASRERDDEILEHSAAIIDDLNAGPGRNCEPHRDLDAQQQGHQADEDDRWLGETCSTPGQRTSRSVAPRLDLRESRCQARKRSGSRTPAIGKTKWGERLARAR